MNIQEANEICDKYNQYDENFRKSKKQGDYRKASEWKARRDELAGKLSEAHRIRRESQA